ncbi:hypothetical protein V2O64_03560 [Verrucomicrobiaceae bacterium 227]
MKYAKFAAVVLILYFLGYVLGPTLNPMLVKEQQPEDLKVAVKLEGGATYEIDLAEYRDADLPETVKILKPATIPTLTGEGTQPLRKDDKVKLLNRKDHLLIVESMDGMAKGTIDPLSTDIYQSLAQKKFDDDAAKLAGTPKAPASIPSVPAPGPAPTPTPSPAPVEPVAVIPPSAPNPVMPAVEPTPEPAPTPPVPEPAGGGDLGEEAIVALMKKSIADGAVKEFTADQVKRWKGSEKETIDGTEYEVGLVAYEAATIFGVKPVQAKALIKGGKVERWVYAKSGMEIQ